MSTAQVFATADFPIHNAENNSEFSKELLLQPKPIEGCSGCYIRSPFFLNQVGDTLTLSCTSVALSLRVLDQLLETDIASLKAAMRIAQKYNLQPLISDAEHYIVVRTENGTAPWKDEKEMLDRTVLETEIGWTLCLSAKPHS